MDTSSFVPDNRFDRIRVYLAKHPGLEERARDYLYENPSASRLDMKSAHFSGLLTGTSSLNLLKEYFGVGTEHFNQKTTRMSDIELNRRYNMFQDFVQRTEGRFWHTNLPKEIRAMIGSRYSDKVYHAVAAVCRADHDSYEPADFLPFAHYMAETFLRRSALFAQEQDRDALESGAYEGLFKAKRFIDFSRSLQDISNYLLFSCFRHMEMEDNFIGGFNKWSIRFDRRRAGLKQYINRAGCELQDIDPSFAIHASQRVVRSLEHLGDRPSITSFNLTTKKDMQLHAGCLIMHGGTFKPLEGINESLLAAEEAEFVKAIIDSIPSNTESSQRHGVSPDRNKAIFTMKVFEGKTSDEIGKYYGFSRTRAGQLYQEVCDVVRGIWDRKNR